jgi:hypothetical protein
MAKAKPQIMHEAAHRVLNSYHASGEPFALFLSSWSFDRARKLVLSFLRPNVRDVQVRIGLERQVRIVLQNDGLPTVSVYRRGDEKRIAIPEEWPALTLKDDEWSEFIADTARYADLIVLFWGVTNESLAREVDLCSNSTNALKTVAVVNLLPRDIWMSELYKIFPRIVPLTEIPPLFPLHPEFESLIDRMRAIKALKPTVRSEIINPLTRLERFPLPQLSGRFNRPIWIE